MLRDSFDWSDLQPNGFKSELWTVSTTIRLPYRRLSHEGLPEKPVPGPVVDVYVLESGKGYSSGNGAQSQFYANDADSECYEEFGIKTFNSFHEAYCAYCRQWVGAQTGLAPNVGRLVAIVYKTSGQRHSLANLTVQDGDHLRVTWGYQTTRCQVNDGYGYSSEAWEQAREEWDDHEQELREQIEIPRGLDQHAEIDVDSDYKHQWIDERKNDLMDQYEYFSDDDLCYDQLEELKPMWYLPSECEFTQVRKYLLNGWRIGKQWWDTNGYAQRLMEYNGFNPMYALSMIEGARRHGMHQSRDGEVVDSIDAQFMHQDWSRSLNILPTGDLHQANVGGWCGDTMIIDWGYHIMGGCQNFPGEVTRGEDAIVPSTSWAAFDRIEDVVYWEAA